MIICDKYGYNRFRTGNITEWTRFSKSRSNDLNTPSHASDHLYRKWKVSIQNCRRYRADTIFKVKVEWPWRYRTRSKVITSYTPFHASDHLCKIWKESIENYRFFARSRPKIFKKWQKNQISRFWKITQHTTHLLMIVIICTKYKKNPSRTVDATERTRFSKSRPKDLEDMGQGQGSQHATHTLMLLIICTKYGNKPSWTVDATWRHEMLTDR